LTDETLFVSMALITGRLEEIERIQAKMENRLATSLSLSRFTPIILRDDAWRVKKALLWPSHSR
jgi:hypothetical protein